MASVQDLTHQSGFVFEAQITQLGASTSDAYPATPETAVVRVTAIVKSTPALSGYEGQLITVHLQSAAGHQVGQQSMFFTHGIHYGDGLVVEEIGSTPGVARSMTADLDNAVKASADFGMTQRLAEAELVVTGVAGAPKPHAAPLAAAAAAGEVVRKVSEHDPDWWSATVTIDAVEKGSHTAKTTEVLYPNSQDVAWFQAPKIKEGDHGVWLLHNRDRYGKAVPALAVTHPLDFRPIADAPRVRNLLK